MKFIAFILFFIICNGNFAQTNSTDMNGEEYFVYGEWKLRKKGDMNWIDSVNFPNSIHKILWDKKLIENPYFGNNEKDLKWIEESDWEAELEFEAFGSSQFQNHEIVFESLEPYIKVYLNDQFIFESKNAFVKYKFDITGLLNKNTDKNQLRLEMDSPVKRGKELQQQNKITLPGDERVYTRKPQYEYGWDWGPRFVKSGVKSWISITTHYNYFTEINNVHFILDELNEKEAKITVDFEIYADGNFKRYLTIHDGYKFYHSENHKLKKGINHLSIPISVKNPEIWWPNGLGKQPLYPFNIEVRSSKSLEANASYSFQYAICDIKLIKEKDSIGESFYFSVNGKPTYLKGFNLIPESHISGFDEINSNYSNLISNLRDLNCNAVRIWGGGEYLSDQTMMDLQSSGILVWQDFMFAGGMYPGDSTFLKNVEEEITYQVKRLRNYNNIALWCGNNEIDEAWHNWGWQKQYNYSKEDSTKIWNDYHKLFNELIPSIVKKYDPVTDYIPSSPEIGWGHKESMTQGDSHYWGVWWGKEPIETFEEKIPRFMSEFGMQAMPDLSTLRKVIPDSLMNFDSPEFKNHQKHPTGFETLNYYLEKYLAVPTDMGDYVYATQLLQAITLQKAIEAHRLSEKCMGTLIWQLNDTWPVTSWSVVDSEGKKKLAANTIQNLFASKTIMRQETDESFYYYLINDLPKNDDVSEIHFILCRFNDTIPIIDTTFIVKSNNGKTLIYKIDKSKIQGIENKIFSYSSVNYTGYFPHFFSDLSDINWEKPVLKVEIIRYGHNSINFQKEFNYYRIHISSDQVLFYPKFFDYPIVSMGKNIIINLSSESFQTEQSAIEYVKKNLKSINHLLGK